MKKIVIASDSHGSANALHRVLRAEPDADAFVFLGDGAQDLQGLSEEFPGLRIYHVLGNCDYALPGPEEGLVAFEGLLFLCVHGHRYSVKTGLLTLAESAHQRGADVALFGHTHVPELEQMEGVYLFNPGSVGRPLDGRPSYGVALCEKGEVKFQHKEVPVL